jgi:tetratricopeptide (TPR) repeat protein
MVRPIALSFPAAIRGPVVLWDELQAWLIPHHVCMRHQEHKVFYQYMIEKLNTREEGARISWDERPVAADSSVGVLGWVLPNVAIIDTAGLNDWVTARTPVSQSRKLRRMAHDRGAPLRYVDCFRPNVLYSRPSIVLPRAEPLTDDDIRNCEQTYRRYTLGIGPLPAIAPSNPGKAVKTREVNEQALRVVNDALAANPSYGLYLNAGILLLALDRSDEAEAAFHRSLELMPSGAGANAQLGKIYEQRNDMKGAAKHYAAALECPLSTRSTRPGTRRAEPGD